MSTFFWDPTWWDCLSSGFYCCNETSWLRSKLGKGFIWFILPCNCSSSKEGRGGTQTGQKPGGRSWCRGHGGVLLTGLLLMACSAFLLIELRTTSPDMASSIVGWALPHQSLIKKCYIGLPIAGSYRGIFSIEVPSSQMTLTCQVDIKLASAACL